MAVEKKLVEVEDGAVLAADVVDAHGAVLLARGSVMSRERIAMLERRGVVAVMVDAPAAGGVAGQLVQVCLERQERVFSKVRGSARMSAVYQAARAHIERGNLPPV